MSQRKEGRKQGIYLLLLSMSSSSLARKVWQAVSCRVLSRMGVSQQTHWLGAVTTSVRSFGDAAALTKEEVQERVIQVVKNMDKVDEGKVRHTHTHTHK